MSKVYVVTKEDMHREPVEAWRVDRLRDEIRKLRCEVVRLKRKAGEEFTLSDLGFGVDRKGEQIEGLKEIS